MTFLRPLAVALAAIVLSTAVVATPAGPALADTASVAPISLATTSGKTTGAVTRLAAIDGDAITLAPRGSKKYSGYRTYQLATSVDPSRVTNLTVDATYLGQKRTKQKWTWAAYNWTAKKWTSIGSNSAATGGTTASNLSFSVSSADRFVSSKGTVRVRAAASNAKYSAKLDAELVTVEHTPAPPVTLPEANGTFDYQLGGAYTPASGVDIVSRDRLAAPVAGLYNICYVNVLQTQPDEPGQSKSSPPYGTTAWWKKHHPSLLLKNSKGTVIVDKDWNEALFDVRTAAKRSALLAVQKSWIAGCANDGFDAVEPDNLDSHLRSKRLISASKTRAYLALLIPYAHSRGLAIAQKNASDIYGSTGPALGFDFAIAEECEHYTECDAYGAYDDLLYEIEYTDENPLVKRGSVTKTTFEWACSDRGDIHSIILRDRDVVPAGDEGYEYLSC